MGSILRPKLHIMTNKSLKSDKKNFHFKTFPSRDFQNSKGGGTQMGNFEKIIFHENGQKMIIGSI